METNTNTNTERRVWVGCLACHKAGRLTGDWLAPEEGPEWVCPTGRPDHEETWVMDLEDFGGIIRGECSPAEAARVDEWLTSAEDQGINQAALVAWADNQGVADFTELDLEGFQEAYCGEYDDMAHYARELFEETCDRPAAELLDRWPFTCIDWEHAGRELSYGDNWTAENPDGGVYVFRSY